MVDDGGLTATAGDRLVGLDADLSDCTELVPSLVALAALADTESTFSGIAHMRGQETDRLRALSAELTRLGGECHETPDGLRVVPRRLHGGVVQTYADHRMVMFAAVLGLAVDGVLVEDVATAAKTVPDFVQRRCWAAMAGHAEPVRPERHAEPVRPRAELGTRRPAAGPPLRPPAGRGRRPGPSRPRLPPADPDPPQARRRRARHGHRRRPRPLHGAGRRRPR